jgi:hypothetical protein
VKTAAVLTRVWLDLTDEQAAALLREPNDVIEGDRFDSRCRHESACSVAPARNSEIADRI